MQLLCSALPSQWLLKLRVARHLELRCLASVRSSQTQDVWICEAKRCGKEFTNSMSFEKHKNQTGHYQGVKRPASRQSARETAGPDQARQSSRHQVEQPDPEPQPDPDLNPGPVHGSGGSDRAVRLSAVASLAFIV